MDCGETTPLQKVGRGTGARADWRARPSALVPMHLPFRGQGGRDADAMMEQWVREQPSWTPARLGLAMHTAAQPVLSQETGPGLSAGLLDWLARFLLVQLQLQPVHPSQQVRVPVKEHAPRLLVQPNQWASSRATVLPRAEPVIPVERHEQALPYADVDRELARMEQELAAMGVAADVESTTAAESTAASATETTAEASPLHAAAEEISQLMGTSENTKFRDSSFRKLMKAVASHEVELSSERHAFVTADGRDVRDVARFHPEPEPLPQRVLPLDKFESREERESASEQLPPLVAELHRGALEPTADSAFESARRAATGVGLDLPTASWVEDYYDMEEAGAEAGELHVPTEDEIWAMRLEEDLAYSGYD